MHYEHCTCTSYTLYAQSKFCPSLFIYSEEYGAHHSTLTRDLIQRSKTLMLLLKDNTVYSVLFKGKANKFYLRVQ